MDVLTRSRPHHATGNQIPPPSNASYDGLPLRRLAGVLARRLDPEPFVLPGHGGAAPTLELSEVAAQPGHLAAILKDPRSILLIHNILVWFYDTCSTARQRNFTDI